MLKRHANNHDEEEGNWCTITEHAGILPFLIILFIWEIFFDRQLSVAVKSMGFGAGSWLCRRLSGQTWKGIPSLCPYLLISKVDTVTSWLSLCVPIWGMSSHNLRM